MDEPAVPSPAPDPVPAPGPKRAARVLEEAWVGGVCAGLAKNLGWSVLLVRFLFVALAAVQFVGVLAYLLLWLVLPPAEKSSSPGIDAATRTGHREDPSALAAPRWRTSDIVPMLALSSLGLGFLAGPVLLGLGLPLPGIIAGCLLTGGVFLLWNAADRVARSPQDERARGGHDRWWRRWVFPARGVWLMWLQILAGVTLLASAGWMIVTVVRLEGGAQTLLIVGLVIAGLLLIVAPFISRVRNELVVAREAKLIADHQADIAAHLHDSVLQTLALIQRQAHDPRLVARLARRQERELRGWLYGDTETDSSLAAALKRVAADVEDTRGVAVEVVAVGDTPLTERIDALVRAAGEAMLNAAKHSGSTDVDVYAEVDGPSVEVFVRDRGSGFDVEAVAADRQGVKGSILDRMARHGGRAVVRSTPGSGTEVRLEMRIDD
jgi:signal transduction histidine kinase/phage shock protein PspC (stress-responsive transcriptional regulator)